MRFRGMVLRENCNCQHVPKSRQIPEMDALAILVPNGHYFFLRQFCFRFIFRDRDLRNLRNHSHRTFRFLESFRNESKNLVSRDHALRCRQALHEHHLAVQCRWLKILVDAYLRGILRRHDQVRQSSRPDFLDHPELESRFGLTIR